MRFVRFVTVLLVLGLALSPAQAGKRKSGGDRNGGEDATRTLDGVVEDMEEIAGLLTFYRSPEKLYLLVPADVEGQEIGFSARLLKSAGDFMPRGSVLDNQVVVWERADHHLLLTKKNMDFRADASSPLHVAVASGFPDSPAFQSALEDLEGDPAPLLVDAGGQLFQPDLTPILSPTSGFRPVRDGTLLLSLKAFPDNVVARVRHRFERQPGEGSGGGNSNSFARFAAPGRLADSRNVEVIVEYHFFRLPDDSYRPRIADERIGGFELNYKDYTGIDGRDTAFRHLLIRWDIRKSVPTAATSPAAQPVVFYIDRSVPPEWRGLIRDATLWWNDAFERVGIQGALEVRDQPDDPDWDPLDIHHSMIYWNLSDDLVFSGMAGPSLVDPRTGKALQGNVYLNAEFFSYSLHRYLVYAWWRAPEPGEAMTSTMRLRRELLGSPYFCDRAPSFSSQIAFARMVLESRGVVQLGTEEADRFAREAFLELVAHEVGHALGFPHNWKASMASSAEDVATGQVDGTNPDRQFSSSVMDYNPIYLAPRGQKQGDYFLQHLGEYDFLTVEYIYGPLDGLSPGEEAVALDAIAAKAEITPGLVYDSGLLGSIDPTSNADDLGDDPLAFAEARLQMIRDEVLPHLGKLVLDEGHDYNRLREALDSAIFSVALDYIDMTARHLGGQILHRRVATSAAAPPGGPPPIQPVTAAAQRRALDILEEHVFADGAYELPPELLSLMKANLQFDWNYPWRFASDYNLGSRIAGLQNAALATLLEPERLARILDNERRTIEDPFTLPELFSRLESTAFGGDLLQLSGDRRSLQRLLTTHLQRLVLERPSGTPAEAGQLAAHSLRSIAEVLSSALEEGPADEYTAAHIEDLMAQIRRVLEARFSLPAGS